MTLSVSPSQIPMLLRQSTPFQIHTWTVIQSSTFNSCRIVLYNVVRYALNQWYLWNKTNAIHIAYVCPGYTPLFRVYKRDHIHMQHIIAFVSYRMHLDDTLNETKRMKKPLPSLSFYRTKKAIGKVWREYEYPRKELAEIWVRRCFLRNMNEIMILSSHKVDYR